MNLDEFTELYLESGFSKDTLREVHALAGGVMRDVVRLVRQIDHVIDLNAPKLERQGITPKNVKAIASKLNLTGGA
ncbi:MAG: hypothetical protein HC933_00700 [Pleurocapsa sp. SU_196_0]|nr:hypothetical protein [Pleurocapsa sp. SU_196_0]